MSAMMTLGAFPILIIAHSSDGAGVVLPVAPMTKEEITTLLRRSLECILVGQEIKIDPIPAIHP